MKKFFAILAAAFACVSCCNCGTETAATTNDFDKYNSVVYELNIRQATVEGTFAAAEQYLPELLWRNAASFL